jgi:hypothetical protein
MQTFHIVALAGVLAAGAAVPAAAQVRLTALVGITGSSALVKDQVIEPIEVKPALAPTLFLSASLPVAKTLRASLDLSYGTSTANITEGGSDAGDAGSLGAFTAAASLVGAISSRLSWRLSLGVLQYMPSDKQGIFADGVPLAALFGAGLDYQHPFSDRWSGVLGIRYDYHRFSTSALEAAGFVGSQQVSRLGLALGASWTHP